MGVILMVMGDGVGWVGRERGGGEGRIGGIGKEGRERRDREWEERKDREGRRRGKGRVEKEVERRRGSKS